MSRSTARSEDDQLCKKHGAEISAFFMTMGCHDMMVILQAPSDEAVAKVRSRSAPPATSAPAR